MVAINKGDNTGAFGNNFLKIYLNNPNNLYIQKALLQINGDLEKEYYEPKFPLKVNFSGAETELMQQVNICKLALWDEFGRRRTAEGKFTFFVHENRVNAPDAPTVDDDLETEENSITFDLDDVEFACEFVVNATPSRLSELQLDIPLLNAEDIIGGKNVQTRVHDNKVIIDANVAAETSYNDLQDKPKINGIELVGDIELPCEQVNADWNATKGPAEILNKPHFASVAYSGNYKDLASKPNIPAKTSELKNDSGFITGEDYYTKEEIKDLMGGEGSLKPVYDRITKLEVKEETDVTNLENKIVDKVSIADFNTVTGKLRVKDTELAETINVLTDRTDVIENQLGNVATTDQLLPIVNQLSTCVTNDTLVASLNTYATKQTVQQELLVKANKTDIGDGKLTIQQNNVVIGGFSANTGDDVTVNIITPTKMSDLVNDTDYTSKAELELDTYAKKSDLVGVVDNKLDKSALGTGILTLKVNNEIKGSFNANATQNKSISIDVPTQLSDLKQDITYLKETDLTQLSSDVSKLSSNMKTQEEKLASVSTEITKKVDKKTGYDLVDRAEISRLAKVDNYDDSAIKSEIQSVKDELKTINVDGKVDKETGKGLSTNDYTAEDKGILYNNNADIVVLKTQSETLSQEVDTLSTNISNTQTTVTELDKKLTTEKNARISGDADLQAQIEALEAKSTVVDIVADTQALTAYDTSKLKNMDVICVLRDEAHEDTVSYYRWVGFFSYIGSEGSYYTKSESDSKYLSSAVSVNGHKLDQDITLSYADVKALPDTTTIGDGVITIQMKDKHNTDPTTNRKTIDTFSVNQIANKAIAIEIPTDLSDLTNEDGYITTDQLLDLHLGRNIPENTLIQDEIVDLQTQIDKNKSAIDTLNGNLPEVALTGNYADLKGLPKQLSDFKKQGVGTEYIDNTFITDLKDKTDFVTSVDVGEIFAEKTEIPQYVSQLENDRGYITMSALGRGDITFTLSGETLGTFNANSKDSTTITIPTETTLNTSKYPVQTITVKTAIDNLDASVVHLAGEETISGAKTFNSIFAPTLATETNSTAVATTAYVKNQDYATNTAAVHKAGKENITGEKTFIGDVILYKATGVTVANTDNSKNLATTEYVKNQDYVTNAEAVHLTGAETINGNKTFAETTTFEGITYLGNYAHVTTDLTVLDCPVSVTALSTVLADYDTAAQVTTKVTNATNTINSNVDTKLQSYYTKTDADKKFLTSHQSLANYYTKTQVDDLLKAKETEISNLKTALEALTARVEALENA